MIKIYSIYYIQKKIKNTLYIFRGIMTDSTGAIK